MNYLHPFRTVIGREVCMSVPFFFFFLFLNQELPYASMWLLVIWSFPGAAHLRAMLGMWSWAIERGLNVQELPVAIKIIR